jgi:hypothetical protein
MHQTSATLHGRCHFDSESGESREQQFRYDNESHTAGVFLFQRGIGDSPVTGASMGGKAANEVDGLATGAKLHPDFPTQTLRRS